MSQLLYKIIITNVWWNNDYKNIPYFETDEEKLSYFRLPLAIEDAPFCNFPVGNMTQPTVTVRSTNVLTSALGFNYAIVKTNSTLVPYLFYFIDNIENTGGEVYSLRLRIDSYTTFYNHCSFGDCLIQRASLNRFYKDINTYFDFRTSSPFLQDDNVGAVPMTTGDTIYQLQHPDGSTECTMKRHINGYCVIFLKPKSDSYYSNFQLWYGSVSQEDKYINLDYSVINDRFSQCPIVVVPIVESGYTVSTIRSGDTLTSLTAILQLFQGEIVNSYIVYDDIFGDLITEAEQSGTEFIIKTDNPENNWQQGLATYFNNSNINLALRIGYKTQTDHSVLYRFFTINSYYPTNDMSVTLRAFDSSYNEFVNTCKGEITLGTGTRNKDLCPMLYSPQFNKVTLCYGSNGVMKDYDLRYLAYKPRWNMWMSMDPSYSFQYVTPYTRDNASIFGLYGDIDMNGMSINESRSLPNINSTLTEWTADHKHYLSITASQIAQNGGISAGTQFIGGLSHGDVAGAFGSVLGSAIETGGSELRNLVSYNTNMALMKDIGGTITGGSALATFVQPFDFLYLIEKKAHQYDLERIYDYYYLYGYKVNKLDDPHNYDNIRHYFNYIQADVESCYPTSDGTNTVYIPAYCREEIISHLRQGVRFWNVSMPTFDFTLENYENEVS